MNPLYIILVGGIGHAFGYNRNKGDEQWIAEELIHKRMHPRIASKLRG